MSDFDEEAERRRLREKYEKDEARREETQQMSELLLKGATMTNQHCGECGSPIFRYDGQEFCPSCQRVAGGAGGQAESEGQTQGDADGQVQPDADGRAPAEANGQMRTDAGADAADPRPDTGAPHPTEQAAGTEDAPTSPEATSVESDAVRAGDEGPTAGASPESAAQASGTAAESPSPPFAGETAGTGDVGEARAALLRALRRHAELAEATEDPRRAKDHLAAAREASEALDALDR